MKTTPLNIYSLTPRPRRILLARVILAFACLMFSLGTQAQIRINTAFESGNGRLVNFNPLENTVMVAPEPKGGDTLKIWYYFKLSGFKLGMPLNLRMRYYKNEVNSAAEPVYSYDRKTWHFFGAGKLINDSAAKGGFRQFSQTFVKNSVYIAAGLPYTYADLRKYLKQAVKKPTLDTLQLTTSEQGRSIPIVHIKGPNQGAALEKKKELIWITARQHAFETPSSYFAEGLMDFLTSTEPEAIELRKKYKFYIAPMMDVDQVAAGGTGKNQLPIDLNRDYNSRQKWKASHALIQKISETAQKNPYIIFADVHALFPNSTDKKKTTLSAYFNNYGKGNNPELEQFIKEVTNAEAEPVAVIYDTIPRKSYQCLDRWHIDPPAKEFQSKLKFALTWEQSWLTRPTGQQRNAESLKETGANFGRALYAYLYKKPLPDYRESNLEPDEEIEVVVIKKGRKGRGGKKIRSRSGRKAKKGTARKSGKGGKKRRRR